jgi:hypothetical protein
MRRTAEFNRGEPSLRENSFKAPPDPAARQRITATLPYAVPSPSCPAAATM